MRKNITTIVALFIAACAVTASVPALAADKPAETAVYAVPHLKDGAVMKELAGALAPIKGVVSAKADSTGAKFLVTFSPEMTAPETLTAAIAKVAPEAKFEGVTAAAGQAEASACGQCPSKATCGAKK